MSSFDDIWKKVSDIYEKEHFQGKALIFKTNWNCGKLNFNNKS